MPEAPAAPGDQQQQPGTTPPPAAPPAPNTIPTPGDLAAQHQQQQPTDPANDGESPWNDPAKARAEIERLRRERGDERIQAKQTAADEAKREFADAVLVALGMKPGEQAPTVESLTASVATVTDERDAARTKAADAERQTAVVRALVNAGVAPGRLDYAEFLLNKRGDISSADPSSDTFGGTLTAAITEVLASDSTLKTPGASVGTGGPGFSGSDGAGQMTKEEFNRLPYNEQVKIFRTDRATFDRLTS